ncbi:UNVERIFIED_CONTAM: hypothetical protein Slati_3930200 [Sesamum latifolium]|uniref:Uncharacterized protein n=1 Tax=Sesamum latifolium TaxID=2727402 RepID=A0AAW2TNV3_9LAMI
MKILQHCQTLKPEEQKQRNYSLECKAFLFASLVPGLGESSSPVVGNMSYEMQSQWEKNDTDERQKEIVLEVGNIEHIRETEFGRKLDITTMRG